MKTKTTKTIEVILLLIALVLCFSSNAQNTFVSAHIARDISGSGLGGNVCPGISFNHNRNTFSIGANFQRKRMNFSGYQFSYSYSAAKNQNEKLELYFTGNFTYHFSAYLSHGNAEIEQSSRQESEIKYDEMKLSVIECYTGIGLKYNPVKNLGIGFTTAMGMFDTLNKDYDREMFREKSAVAMQFRMILVYNFKS